MSRPLRIEYPGAWYHIMNRGRRGENIFETEEDREIFVALLKESAELWDVRISAYCQMSTHYHILAQTPQGNLSRFMRHLNGVYTQRYNRVHGYDGQLFRGRFKSILVEEENYLLELVRYIHRNPLRAGMVEMLDKYPWSSHHGYLSTSKAWEWLYKDFIMSALSEKKGRRKAYLRFVAAEDSEEILGIFEKKKWPSLLGSKDFISWVKETFFRKKKHREVPESAYLAPERQQIIREVRRFYGVVNKDLFTSQRGKSNEPRDAAIYLCRILRNDTLIDLSQAFGMTGYSPASSAVERTKKNMIKNKELQQKIKQIKISLFAEKGQGET